MSIGAPPQGTPPAMATPGSLTSLMDGLVALQATVSDHPLLEGYEDRLNCYRWRPDQVDSPALYNWMLPSSAEMRDLSRIRDSIVILTRIGARFTDVEDRMAYIEAATDAYRAIVDPSYWNGQATPAVTRAFATWAIRVSMQSFSEQIGSTPLLGFEIQQTFWIDRHI